jgi:hypothetical protein|tara:strand:+ start:159 stop:350 length:192 start_codon:yes stop_codon:yes gene_type:complete
MGNIDKFDEYVLKRLLEKRDKSILEEDTEEFMYLMSEFIKHFRLNEEVEKKLLFDIRDRLPQA